MRAASTGRRAPALERASHAALRAGAAVALIGFLIGAGCSGARGSAHVGGGIPEDFRNAPISDFGPTFRYDHGERAERPIGRRAGRISIGGGKSGAK